ncbi:site-specific DNA-methyltransferase [bacterium]|nr:site-specific DNA-methyltransferase [bacterium]
MSEEEAKATVDKSQTGNISKQNREDLLGKIKEIRTYIASAPQDENTGNLLRYLSEIEKDVNGHKYGLVFEEHREDIDVVLDTYTPVLTEQEELFIDNGGQMNFLVEGDNLASLKLLEKTHKGKIDVIYIDPPYNTKNKDFIYDDIFIDNVDGFRHSKWVSFIQPRLKLAKSLLTQGGVIFISIDDNEQAALKMLCDNIFGEHNFVSQLVWEKKKKGSFLSDSITNIKEYILVYTNNKLAFKGLIGEVNDNTETYPCINAVNKREVRKIPKGIKSNYKEKNHFLPAGTIISDTTMNIIFLTDLIIKDNVLAEDVEIEGNWRYSQDAMWEYGLKGEIYITRDLYLRRIVSQARHKMMKDLLPRVGNDTELTYNSLIDINDLFASGWGSNEDADEELRLILGKQKLFDYPKPTRLLTKLLLATRKPNAVCLDFFAGSGTFGHAVMSSNLLDNGIRKFILCTNNENNICRDVTYERIKRVIDKENYEASLKYFKVEYVPIDEQLYYEYADELLCHVKELVELENGINFTENAEIGIVLTDEEIFDFFDNIDEYSNCKKLYIGHDLLLDEEQEAIVSKNGIQVIIIPDYYYRDLQDS